MRKLLNISALFLLLLSGNAFAGMRMNPHTGKPDYITSVSEDDGSPSGVPMSLRFSNGTVTDNGDGSYSVNTLGSAGAPTTASYLLVSNDGTLTSDRFVAGTVNQIKITDNGAGSSFVIGASQDIATASSPSFAGLTLTSTPLAVASGGTAASSASITAFNNITGLSAAGTTGTTSTSLVFSTSPALVTPALGVATATSVTGPLFASNNADPADAGLLRLGNAENIAWEANPTGTDLTLTMDANNVLTSSVAINATTGYRIGNAATSLTLLTGNGTNFVQSAYTMAAPSTSGNVLTSNGTNWTSAAAAGASAPLTLTGTSNATQLKVIGFTTQSVPVFDVQEDAGTSIFSVYVNPAMTGINNLAAGVSAGDSITTGIRNIMFGTNAGTAVTEGNNLVLIGGLNCGNGITTGGEIIIIGSGGSGAALTTEVNTILIGQASGTVLTGSDTIGIGSGVLANATVAADNIALGAGAGDDIVTGTNYFVAGSPTDRMDYVTFGEGIRDASPTNYTIHGNGASGTDTAGGSIGINGGQGTGTGAGGSIIMRVAPAGATSSVGNVSIDTVTVTSKRHVLINTSSDFTAVIQSFTPDNGIGMSISIDEVQANITAADTFLNFDSKSGTEAQVVGTAAAGVIAFSTWTSEHWTKIDDKTDIEPCMVLVSTGEKFHETKGQLTKSAISTKRGDKAVYGGFAGTNPQGYDNVFAGGTAYILVCNEGGDINVGDYLESSNTRGYACKQEGDAMLNSTVARAMEIVIWEPGETKKRIACIYVAG